MTDDKPRRVQLSRRKGWRMPPNTVKVSRPTKWGNPFALVDALEATLGNEGDARRACVNAYKRYLYSDEAYLKLASPSDAMNELRGKNLACWCPLDQVCHADVLLKIANSGERE